MDVHETLGGCPLGTVPGAFTQRLVLWGRRVCSPADHGPDAGTVGPEGGNPQHLNQTQCHPGSDGHNQYLPVTFTTQFYHSSARMTGWPHDVGVVSYPPLVQDPRVGPQQPSRCRSKCCHPSRSSDPVTWALTQRVQESFKMQRFQ